MNKNTTVTAKPSRIAGLDIIRTFAIISVVTVHSFMQLDFYSYSNTTSPLFFLFIALRTLFNEAVPLFLLLTGFLQSDKVFGKKHYLSIIPLWITYALSVVAAYLAHVYIAGDTFGFSKLVYSLFCFGINSYSWYFEMFIGLFLLIPFLNLMYKAISEKKHKLWLIVIMIFMTSLPGFFTAFPMGGGRLNILPAYWTSVYPLSCYFIGAFLKEYRPKIKKSLVFLLTIGAVLSVSVLQFLGSYGDKVFNRYIYSGEGALPTIVIGLLIFLLLYDVDVKSKTLSAFFREISLSAFDIYMFSYTFDLIIYDLADRIGIHKIVFFPFCSLTVLAVTFVFSIIKRYIFKEYTAILAHSKKPIFRVLICMATVALMLASLYFVEADADKALYLAGLKDCERTEAEEIYPLAMIADGSIHTTWNEAHDRVLLVIRNDTPEKYCDGETVKSGEGCLFAFTQAEMLEWYRAEGKHAADKKKRIDRLLGMKPGNRLSQFTAVWVSPYDIVRPIEIGGIANVYGEGEEDSEQLSLFASAIGQSQIDGMLFTGLGYFYDYEDNGRDYGLTCFVIKPGSEIEVEYTKSNEEYFASLR